MPFPVARKVGADFAPKYTNRDGSKNVSSRSRSCPQCRAKCGRRDVHRVYFNIANLDTSNIDVASVQQQLDDMKLQMIEKERALNKASEEIETLKAARKKCMYVGCIIMI